MRTIQNTRKTVYLGECKFRKVQFVKFCVISKMKQGDDFNMVNISVVFNVYRANEKMYFHYSKIICI